MMRLKKLKSDVTGTAPLTARPQTGQFTRASAGEVLSQLVFNLESSEVKANLTGRPRSATSLEESQG